MDAAVRAIRRGEIRRASLLLAAAFADDPFIGYFLGARRRREVAVPLFFRAVLHELAVGGAVSVLEADGAMAGVAAWEPPGDRETKGRSPVLARIATLRFRALFPRGAAQLLGGFDALGRRHPSVPHWYLAFVGIDPLSQGRGFGRTLLEPVLARADAAAIPCYLETPFPDTRTFYRRLGFEETDQLQPVAGAPPIWTMTRPAGPRT